MLTNTIRDTNPSQQMMWGSMHTNPIFFLGGKGEGMGKEGAFKLLEFGVPKCILCDYVFCSLFVPQVPNSTKLYTLCFAQSPPLVNYIGSSKEKTTLGVFWEWGKLRSLGHVGMFYFRSLPLCGCFWWPNWRKYHQNEK
jgi:hypothetical protein